MSRKEGEEDSPYDKLGELVPGPDDEPLEDEGELSASTSTDAGDVEKPDTTTEIVSTSSSNVSLEDSAYYEGELNKVLEIAKAAKAKLEEKKAQAGKEPAVPSDGVKRWDFRHGKLPDGVKVVGDGNLEVQADKSTALALGPKSFLVLDLNLPANGGNTINDFALTMDIKLDSLPKESISMFQANFAKKDSEGEAYIDKTGGVGIYGEYGVENAYIKEKKMDKGCCHHDRRLERKAFYEHLCQRQALCVYQQRIHAKTR